MEPSSYILSVCIRNRSKALGFRAQGCFRLARTRVWRLRLRVEGSGFQVDGLKFRVLGLEVGVYDSGLNDEGL